jgi:hypothetical protein
VEAYENEAFEILNEVGEILTFFKELLGPILAKA